MSRISHLSRPMGRALLRPSSLSSQCTCRAAFFSTTPAPRADKKTEFTEKLRSKIWGTDNAPGREDPYSHDSPMRGPRRPTEQVITRGPTQPTTGEEVAMVEGAVEGAAEGEQEKLKPKRKKVVDTYKPAKTAEGLRWVGGESGGLEKEETGTYVPALNKEKVKERKAIEAAVREALVEVVGAKGTAEGAEWRAISLQDPAVKFEVVKRVMILTGTRISDPVIAQSNTAGILLDHITKREPPRKLAETLERKHTLAKLSNVKFSAKRVTPIDKEKQVGRWKVIEQALLDKNLPVTGHKLPILP